MILFFLRFLLILIIITISSHSFVFAADELTWQEVVKEAIKNHPDLVSSKEKINQAKASKALLKSGFFPQIEGNVGATTSKDFQKARTENYSYGVIGRQLIFDGFKTAFDTSAAQANIKAAQYNYDVISSNVRLRLRTAFIDLLNAQELLKVTKDIAARRKQNLDLINLRYEGGREHRGSLLTAQADNTQALFEVKQAARNVYLSQRRLSKELGREKFVSIVVQSDFDLKNLDEVQPDFENLAETIPFLKELIVQKEAAKLGVKSAGASFFPQIYATGGFDRSDSHWPSNQDNWSAGVSLSIPLFEGGRNKANLNKAQAAFYQVKADERSGRDGVILTLAESWTDFQDAFEKVDVQNKFLEAAVERAKIAEAQYSKGLVSFNDWILIEDNLVSAKKLILEAQANALIAEARWVQARGGLVDDK